MKKQLKIGLLLALAAILLCGCNVSTVESMYTPPKRSQQHTNLQAAIDAAMSGLEYYAPRSGENQQTVQSADLDGDGVVEHLLFARGTDEKPLKILIFRSAGESYTLSETIESFGSSFDQVEYVNIDDRPGLEMVVGRQISNQVVGAATVYTFSGGQAEQLMNGNYSNYLTCDLDEDKNSELILFHPGDAEEDNGVVEYYTYENGVMERSCEAAMSQPVEHMKRIMFSKLADGSPAVYVASAVDENSMVTDAFAIVRGKFSNVVFSSDTDTNVKTLRNYYVYAADIDDDGIVELPDLVNMSAQTAAGYGRDIQYLIHWYALRPNGDKVTKMYTYHNFGGGWYVTLDSLKQDPELVSSVSVVQESGAYCFYLKNEQSRQLEKIMTIYAFTGQDREAQAASDGRFALYRTDGVVYAADLGIASVQLDITEMKLINGFHMIHHEWKTGEM